MVKKKEKLLFIDTNILLDFYRVRTDAGITLLNHIDGLHEITITTSQIEMEFKKNRQKAIFESLTSLKAPDASITPPAFLSEAKTVELMKKRMAETKSRVSKLKVRIKRIIERPSTYDPVYKVAQRLFSNVSPHNLRAGTDEFQNVYGLAWKRFIQGYPPRKRDDTAIGDSINWEWIIQCAIRTGQDVLVVSRDADYGMTHDGVTYINDWLLQEFKNRVSQQRKIEVVDRLSTALKRLSVSITDDEAKEERAVFEVTPGVGKVSMNWDALVEDLLKRRFADGTAAASSSEVDT